MQALSVFKIVILVFIVVTGKKRHDQHVLVAKSGIIQAGWFCRATPTSRTLTSTSEMPLREARIAVTTLVSCIGPIVAF